MLSRSHPAPPDAPRAAETRATRARLRLYTAAFFIDATAYAFYVLLPVHAQRAFDAGPLALGALGTTVTGVYAVLCLFTGRWSDTFGSRPLYLLGVLVLAALALPALLLAPALEWLFVPAVLFGAGLSFCWPPIERELSCLSPPSRLARTVGTFNCTWAAGMSLGTLGGASLYEALGAAYGGTLSIAFALLAFSVLVVPVPARPAAADPDPPRPGQPPLDSPPLARGTERFLVIAWIANIAAYFAFHSVNHLFTHLRAHLGFSVSLMGLFLFSLNAARLVSFLVLRQFSGWQYSMRWLIGAQSAAAIALLALSFARTAFPFFVLLPVLGAFAGLAYFSSFYYGLRVPSREGRNSGLHETFLSAGGTIGPLVAGLAAAAAPGWPGIILACGSAAILLALWIEWRLARRK